MITTLRAVPYFLKNLIRYIRLNKENSFRVCFKDIFYKTYDRFNEAGTMSTHYFYQDLWAAKYLHQHKITEHVDVGSRLDGFIAHTLLFSAVCYRRAAS